MTVLYIKDQASATIISTWPTVWLASSTTNHTCCPSPVCLMCRFPTACFKHGEKYVWFHVWVYTNTVVYMLVPVVTIAGMFGPVLRVILLPVPWQGGVGGGYRWTPSQAPQVQVHPSYFQAQMISQCLAKNNVASAAKVVSNSYHKPG